MDIREIALRMALKNALLHKGKANTGAVMNYILGAYPELKQRIRDVGIAVKEAVEKINSLTLDEQLELSAEYGIEIEKRQRTDLPDLPNVSGKVVTRFPPEPSGYPHIGHAKAALLGFLYARKYGGKFILRFDDTNPEKARFEYYEAIRDGLEWLGIEWDVEKRTTDDMEVIYSEAERLLKSGDLYVCTCPPEEIRERRFRGEECPCRSRNPDENLDMWRKMFSEIEPGKAIVRLKGDMKSQNTAMRDPTMFRIIDAFHPMTGTKYRVWPNYDFAVVVEDHLDGITHMMRSKEYELRDELYRHLMGKLGYQAPEIVSISRLKIRGMPVSKRKLRPLVQEGKVSGWDDPRMPTLAGLRRRGMQPEAIREFIVSQGVSKTESVIEFEMIEAFNRKYLDPITQRRFFVPGPVELLVEGAPERVAVLRNHPTQDMGTREILTQGKFFVPSQDLEGMEEGEVFRLKDLYNVRITEKGRYLIRAEYAGDEITSAKKIQWVVPGYVDVKVLVPGLLFDDEGNFNDNSLITVTGYAESSLMAMNPGDMVQFERFGFCRIDSFAPDGVILVKTHD